LLRVFSVLFSTLFKQKAVTMNRVVNLLTAVLAASVLSACGGGGDDDGPCGGAGNLSVGLAFEVNGQLAAHA
jgi:hypothetical protein